MSEIRVPNEPVLQTAEMHVYKPNNPGRAVITRNEVCTASRKAAGFIRHIEFDISESDLVGRCIPGQSIGVIPPGADVDGKPHKVRLYSIASPSRGEDGEGRILSTTVKRTIDEHWEDHKLFLGVASNFLCDTRPGDEIVVTGPAGKRFVLPEKPENHDYIFIATGTGIAPFRGMVLELLQKQCPCRIALLMGAPYWTDLIYDDQFRALETTHENFSYHTALSRQEQADGHGRMYVQGRIGADFDRLGPMLGSERTLIYICGIAGMEIGIFQELTRHMEGEALEQYLHVDDEVRLSVDEWSRRMIHKQVRPTRRVLMEVYA